MGGNIGVESQQGTGSTFWFTVQFGVSSSKIPDEPTEQLLQPLLPNPLNWAHLLLVEDNPVNQDLCLEMLNFFGCTVTLVDSGAKALAALDKQTYDLVLMDCQMPEMDGYEVTRIIRRREQEECTEEQGTHYPKAKIIALTANAFLGDREKCLTAGMDDYLAKPFTLKQLHQVLLRWLATNKNSPGEGWHIKSGQSSILPSSDKESSVINREFIDSIRSLQHSGSPDLLEMVIDKFVTNFPGSYDSMLRALVEGDTNGIREAAHGLKSGSANLGATSLAELCKKLEHLARNNSTEGATELLAQIEIAFIEAKDALHTFKLRNNAQ
jgi:CheY-like chemotaxis protein/HPt (histidine-containing phosphotransfer) domain-containing protein